MTVSFNRPFGSLLESGTLLSQTAASSLQVDESFPEIVGRCETTRRVLETVMKVARSDSAVLVYGESGTGKELIASAIHRLSGRAAKPFIPINCSAIPDDLLESELFGHEKGAFTGADRRRAGHFEAANGGTIFLDEIGDMPARLQSKLLRVLQEKQLTRVGGNQILKADVRVIAATNVDLEQAVKNQSFRLDLFYRLNVLPITMPPLRERQQDIPDLLNHFLNESNRVHSLDNPCQLSVDVVSVLTAYRWPGNVRELQNLIERLVVLKCGGMIHVEDLPANYLEDFQKSTAQTTNQNISAQSFSLGSGMPTVHHLNNTAEVLMSQQVRQRSMNSAFAETVYPADFGTLPNEGLNLTDFIEKLENNYIIQALERTQNNKNQAAKLLGLNRTTLVERIKKRKIVPLNSPSREI